MYVYSIRFAKPGGPETQHQTSFPTIGCQLEDVFQIWCQLGHLCASFWGTFAGSKRLADKNGTKKHPDQKRYQLGARIVLLFSLLLGLFLEDVLPKCVFVSMCLASVVLHRKCLDYRTPRTPIIKSKRCRVIQNQGFANLGTVGKVIPQTSILTSFWRPLGTKG